MSVLSLSAGTAQTPCGVLYQIASHLVGSRGYEDIDCCLLSKDNFDSKGRTPFSRSLRTATFRTREIIQKDPRLLDASVFAPPYRAARDLLARASARGLSAAEVVAYLSGEGVSAMSASLAAYGADRFILENSFRDVICSDARPTRKALALLLLLVLTAFTGDPCSSYSLFVERAASQELGIDLETGPLDAHDRVVVRSEVSLVRRYGEAYGSHLYPLSKDAEGTIIGRAGTASHTVNEVGPSVSRKHARVFWDGGAYRIEGLDAKHGTWVRHRDRSLETVEPPRASVPEGGDAIVTISPGDEILLGSDTVFRVLDEVVSLAFPQAQIAQESRHA